MNDNWTLVVCDTERDGENDLKISYYERIKAVDGLTVTIEVGRSMQIDNDEATPIESVREYKLYVGGNLPWREFTLADYQRLMCEHIKSHADRKSNNRPMRYRNADKVRKNYNVY